MKHRKLGPYEIVEELSTKDTATTYRAVHPPTQQTVAIKVPNLDYYSPGIESDANTRARSFAVAIQRFAQFQHPHILPPKEAGSSTDTVFIVYDFLEGGSLSDLINKNQRIPLERTISIIRQVAAAMDFIHQKNVIHRNIKPSNILFDQAGTAYLTDFGMAIIKPTARGPQSGIISGTPSHMAPEQWRGEPVDARTDVYALGVTLYEMVLGQLPFVGDSPHIVMFNVFTNPPPPPREIDPNLAAPVEAVILRALAKAPDDRYQTAGQLADALAQAMGTPPGN